MSQQPTPTPRLSVSTASSHPHSHAGPSQQGSGSIGRRPQGARRRGVAAGLYVANPDNSDEDVPPGQSNSPVRSQSSPTSHAPGHGHGEYRGLPTIPQSSSVPSLQSQLQVQQSQSQTPPLPPPQPDRHARRAFTTPLVPDAAPHRPMDTRHTSLSAQGQAANSQSQVPPPSPSRMRHALPSPPTVSSPSMQSHDSRPLPLPLNPRMSSPEETLSPMTESSMSTTSLGATSRARSGSFNTSAATKRLLQVTTDNEQFTLVDITGMNTAEAIRDRIFSKVSQSFQE
jgi:mitogen-activated protein kinase kinase kinase